MMKLEKDMRFKVLDDKIRLKKENMSSTELVEIDEVHIVKAEENEKDIVIEHVKPNGKTYNVIEIDKEKFKQNIGTWLEPIS